MARPPTRSVVALVALAVRVVVGCGGTQVGPGTGVDGGALPAEDATSDRTVRVDGAGADAVESDLGRLDARAAPGDVAQGPPATDASSADGARQRDARVDAPASADVGPPLPGCTCFSGNGAYCFLDYPWP